MNKSAENNKVLSGKFTPGPWKACLNVPTARIEGHIIKASHGAETPIASLWVGGGTHGKEHQLANASLIASAPELLEALKGVVSGHAMELGEDNCKCHIHKLIVKAEGRA